MINDISPTPILGKPEKLQTSEIQMTDAANVTKNSSRSDAGFTNLIHKIQATIKTAAKIIVYVN